LTTASLLFLLAAVTVNARQVTGVLGSPTATTTIDGRQLPAPETADEFDTANVSH